MAGPCHGLARERQMLVVEIEMVQRRDAVEGARRGRHQLGPGSVPRQTGDSLCHVAETSIVIALTAHYSCTSVDVCGVSGRVSAISP
jgi:hypothetical protein